MRRRIKKKEEKKEEEEKGKTRMPGSHKISYCYYLKRTLVD